MTKKMKKKIKMTASIHHSLPQSHSFNIFPSLSSFYNHFSTTSLPLSLSLHASPFINIPLLVISLFLHPYPSNMSIAFTLLTLLHYLHRSELRYLIFAQSYARKHAAPQHC